MTSCSLTKNLEDNDLVYMGTEIELLDKQQAKSIERFQYNIDLIPPTPTRTGIGNVYIGLYNIFNNAEKKGFKNWVRNRLGEKPVIYKNEMIDKTEAKLGFYLNGKGFFSHNINCDTSTQDRKINITCDITLGERYKIDSLIFPIDTTYIALELDEQLKRAILKEGNYYDRDRLEFERLRLSTLAGDLGFADFGVNNIYFYVDSAKTNNMVDIYTEVLQPTDSTYHTRYLLDSIKVYTNYTINRPSNENVISTQVSDNLTVYEDQQYLSHTLLDRLIIEDPDWYYNRSLEKKSINRLLDLGLFRFINVVNQPSPSGDKAHIVQNIYLTPDKMQGISGEVEINNRSGNFLGTGASINYEHKNLFHHAERLDISLGGQLETQFGDGLSLINSSDVNASAELAIPRFIVPFFTIKEGKNYVPRTVIKLNYTYQRRVQFYTLQSLSSKYGYKWRESSTNLHELYPINLNQVRVTDKTPEFQNLLDDDIRLSRSFDDILISGLQYYFTFSDQDNLADKRYQFFRAEVETSGNILSLISGADKANPKDIAGLRFAQFGKLTLDYRRYFPLRKGSIATRTIIGIGAAYGNSEELPYIKQYLIGGSNSIRAFRLRGLGPGLYFPPTGINTPISSQLVDQTGDVKLEMNVEYRFPIFNYLKGALFVDAGNIWLLNSKERSEGNFSFKDFYTQLGVGTGLGFRLDFGFFLIRLDIAFPLRAPTLNGFDWQFSDIAIHKGSWRSDNLRYNLGIGYPF